MDAINIITAMDDPIKVMKDIGKRYQEGGKSRDIAKAEGIAFLVDMKACGAPPQARAGAAGAMFGMTDAKRIWQDELKWSLKL